MFICFAIRLLQLSKINFTYLMDTLPTRLQRTNTENSKQIFRVKRNCAATIPISTFMCLWAIYIFQRSIRQFCCRKHVDRSIVHRHMNLEIETKVAQFPEKEYINGIFFAVYPGWIRDGAWQGGGFYFVLNRHGVSYRPIIRRVSPVNETQQSPNL